MRSILIYEESGNGIFVCIVIPTTGMAVEPGSAGDGVRGPPFQDHPPNTGEQE
jgi:hypothetical protein